MYQYIHTYILFSTDTDTEILKKTGTQTGPAPMFRLLKPDPSLGCPLNVKS